MSATLADVAQMIACLTCRAKVCEPCRTASGNATEHVLRLVPRRCRCGELLGEGRHPRYCEACRINARRRSYWRREVKTPTSQRRQA